MALPFEVVLLEPRGICAGVQRAIATVNEALARFGAPVYVRHPIVHNDHVLARLAARGALFVDELDEVPPGAVVVLSAHGVAPAVIDEARRHQLRVIDATCPLVAKVHRGVQRAIAGGATVVLVGERDHDEVIGTLGHGPPGAITVVSDAAEAARVELPAAGPVALASQTTLSVDDLSQIVAALGQRLGGRLVAAEHICYATQGRQGAVRAAAAQGAIHRLLVVGSPGSSNSRRLVQVAERSGIAARLIDGADELDAAWLEDGPASLQRPALSHGGVLRVGVTAGASTPDDVVDALVARLVRVGGKRVVTFGGAEPEVRFPLPRFDAED